jgi:hypothetical protein
MIIARKLAVGALLALASATAPAAHAGQDVAIRSFGQHQAISYSFGSKRAVGYFAAHEGTCSLSMFLAEGSDDVSPSATRLSIKVKPGDSAHLASVEGQGLEVTCGVGAASVDVRQTGLRAAVATQ